MNSKKYVECSYNEPFIWGTLLSTNITEEGNIDPEKSLYEKGNH